MSRREASQPPAATPLPLLTAAVTPHCSLLSSHRARASKQTVTATRHLSRRLLDLVRVDRWHSHPPLGYLRFVWPAPTSSHIPHLAALRQPLLASSFLSPPLVHHDELDRSVRSVVRRPAGCVSRPHPRSGRLISHRRCSRRRPRSQPSHGAHCIRAPLAHSLQPRPLLSRCVVRRIRTTPCPPTPATAT